MTLPTIILRHRKENLKKCSLSGLKKRPGFRFLTYPKDQPPSLASYVILALGHEELSEKDSSKGLFLIDSTWRYAGVMLDSLKEKNLQFCSLPKGFKTAYPRYQTFCPDPERGLSSIEALYIAFLVIKRNPEGLLENYRWKDNFLKINGL